jgi:hypothetical protein
MLQAISWLQFSTFILVGLVAYYSYVLFWKCRGLVMARLKKEPEEKGKVTQPGKRELPVPAAAAEGAGDTNDTRSRKPELAAVALVGDGVKASGSIPGDQGKADKGPEGIPEQETRSAVEQISWNMGVVKVDSPDGPQGKLFPIGPPGAGKPESQLLKASEKVVLMLRALLDEAAMTRVDRMKFEGRIQQLLSGYQYLRGTPYEAAINGLLVRICGTAFELELKQGDILRLWGGGDVGDDKAGEASQDQAEGKNS